MNAKAYSKDSKYKNGDLLKLWQSQRRFSQLAKELETILREESQWVGEHESGLIKTLVKCFNSKKDVIK